MVHDGRDLKQNVWGEWTQRECLASVFSFR